MDFITSPDITPALYAGYPSLTSEITGLSTPATDTIKSANINESIKLNKGPANITASLYHTGLELKVPSFISVSSPESSPAILHEPPIGKSFI